MSLLFACIPSFKLLFEFDWIFLYAQNIILRLFKISLYVSYFLLLNVNQGHHEAAFKSYIRSLALNIYNISKNNILKVIFSCVI